MKNLNFANRNWKIVAAFGFAAGMMGCGQSAAPGVVPPAPVAAVPAATTSGCPAGQISIAGGPCVSSANFTQACQYSGGQLATVNGNANVCRVQRFFNPFNQPGFPILTPSTPQSPLADYQMINVKPGDRVTLNGTVTWGPVSASTDTFLSIFHVTTWSTNCTDISSSGMKGTTQLTNEGMNAGFVVSDGTQVYTLPATIANAGTLRTGFNASADLAGNGACYQVNVSSANTGLGYTLGTGVLSLLHCEDSTGQVYPCP